VVEPPTSIFTHHFTRYHFGSASLDVSPWPLVTMALIWAEIVACEIRVCIENADLHMRLRGALHWDVRTKSGLGGRILRQAFPALGLRKNDRLEPGPTLLDTWLFDALSVFPITVTFWRVRDRNRLNRNSPLWTIPGFGIEYLAIDFLHCLDLGVLQKFVGVVFWLLLLSDAFVSPSLAPILSEDSRLQLGLLYIKSLLYRFYARARIDTPGFSEIWNLTMHMLGSKADPTLGAKAAETRHLMDFVAELLRDYQEYMPQPDGELLKQACSEMVEFIRIMNTSPRNMDIPTRTRFMNCYLRFVTLFERAAGDLQLQPKHHLTYHACQRTRVLGNPKFSTTHLDEHTNGVCARIARSTHRMTFAKSVFKKLNLSRTL